MNRLILSATLVFSMAMLVVGCGEGGPPRVVVSGKVKLNGKPVPQGTIVFVTEDQKTVAEGAITNGEYTMARAPVGSCKVTINTPMAPGAGAAKQSKQKVEGKSAAESTANVVSVPDKYRNIDSSGLTYTVTKDANQTKDWDLK